MRAAIALLFLAGCDRLFNLDHFPDIHHDAASDGAQVDVPPMRMIDARVDAPNAACTSAGIACNGSVTAFVCDNQCFITCDENVIESIASSRCTNSTGAKLAMLDTVSIDQCVTSHLSEFSWIGLVQFPAEPLPSAGWYWLISNNSVYRNWMINEPNDADGNENGQEDCAYANNSGGWNDTPCSDSLGFVCER